MRFGFDPKVPTATCKSCDAAIVWIRTSKGKNMPLDLASAKQGLDGTWTAESHFAHCDQADDWRRDR